MAGTIALLLCFLIPRAVREKRKETCRRNLRDIGIGFKTFGLTDPRYPPRTPVAEGGTAELVRSGQVFVHFRGMMSNGLSAKSLVCPADRKKKVADHNSFSDDNVSYFIGVDAADEFPDVMLSGDRNLAVGNVPLKPGLFMVTTNTPLVWAEAIHGSCGNILMGDGSIQFVNSTQLTALVHNQGLVTNRLAIP
jgi:hypothetical protein